MIFVLIVFVCIAFITFFVLLNLWYLSLLPFFFMLFFFSQGFSEFKPNISNVVLGERYGLYLLSLLVFFWLFGMLNFFWMTAASALWFLLFLCGIARILSYLVPYEDGKYLFRYGMLLLGLVLVGNHLSVRWGEGLLSLGGAILFTWILFFWALAYWVRNFVVVDPNEEKHFFFLLLLLVEYGILSWVDPLLYGFDIGLYFWTVILTLFVYIFSLPTPQRPFDKQISIRRVLAGEKIIKREKIDRREEFLAFLRNFKELPSSFSYGLEYLNVIFLVGVLVTYLWWWVVELPIPQFAYWMGVAGFLINIFLLKKIKIFSLLSRFAAALVINFSLTISLINMGDGMQQMLPWLVTWNIWCGVILLYAKQPAFKSYIQRSDLVFWLISNLVAMLFNIVLLFKLDISGQLLFSLIFFYVGVQGVLSYYALPVITGFDEQKKAENLDALLDKEMWGVL